MADNIQIDVSTTLENVNVEVAELPQPSISIDYSYPQGPQGIQGPPGVNTWGSLSGALSAQTDLWYYLSAGTLSPSQLTAFLASNAINLCSINVSGTILSAGVNLFDIFLTSETDSQTLSYIPSSYQLSISNGNTVNLSSINSFFGSVSSRYEEAYSVATVYQSVSSSFATNTTVSNVSGLLTPLTLTNNLTGQLVLNTDFQNYKTDIAATTATLLPTSIYQSASSYWQEASTTVQAGSSNWYSASGSALQASKNYSHQNFVPLSGGAVIGDSLTISGDLYLLSSVYMSGSAFYVNAQDLIVSDPIIYIAEDNQADILDIGFMASWTNAPGYPTGYQHGGFVRRADNKTWTLFSGATSEPLSALNVFWAQSGIQLEPLSAKFYGDIYGNRFVYGSLSATGAVNGSNLNINNWNQAYNVSTAYQNVSSSFATNTTLNSVSSLLTPLTLTRTLTGQLATNTTLNSVSSELKSFRGGITVTVGRANCDFNCVGSLGSPTDHTVIQSAINSISATGGQVTIAEGTYYLGSTISIQVPNISVTGTGRATQLLAVGDYGDVFNCALSSVPSQFPGMAGLQFSQLRFETTVSRTYGAAIRADYTHNAIFRDLYISDTTYGVSYGLVSPVPPAFWDGIYLDAQDQCHISKIVAQCANYSVHVNGSGYANADFSYDGYVENCDFYGVPGSPKTGVGIHLGPNCGGFLIDYVSVNQLDYGVYADATGTTQGGGIITIRGGYAENTAGHGYRIIGYQNTVVEQLWGSLYVTGGKTIVTGVPNGSIVIDGGTALVYGTPASISGTGTWEVIDTAGGGGGGGSAINNNKYIYLTTGVTLTSNYKFSIDTTASSLTATLPATPAQGDEIEIFDIAGTWNTNNLVVNNNSKLIESINDNLLCNVQYGLVKLVYTGDTTGWRIVPMPIHNVAIPAVPPTPPTYDPYSDYVTLLLHFNT